MLLNNFRLFLFSFHVVAFVCIALLLPPDASASEFVSPQPYQRKVLLTGFTHPRQVAGITSEVSGKCIQVNGDVGDVIEEGGVFAAIDDTFIKLDIAANRLQRQRVERQLATEQKMLKRYTTLRRENSATEAKFDEVQLSADLHELTLKDLENQYERLAETLVRHKITAPVDWLVIQREIEQGEFVQVGQVVAEVGDFRELVVPFALSYDELSALQMSDNMNLYLPDLKLQVSAQLHRVSPSFSEATKKIGVEVMIASQQDGLDKPVRGGLRAQLSLLLSGDSNTFVLPLTAIINRYDAHWVLGSDGKRTRVIFLGSLDDGVSGKVSSTELEESDTLYRNIPADF